MPAGAPKKYNTDAALRRAVKKYFDSITRWRVVTEKVPTGRKDNDGHMIFEDRTVLNVLGEEGQSPGIPCAADGRGPGRRAADTPQHLDGLLRRE